GDRARDRPPVSVLPPPLAIYEALIRLSLGTPIQTIAEPVVLRLADRLRAPGASAQDAATTARWLAARLPDAVPNEPSTRDVVWWELLPRVSYRETTLAPVAATDDISAAHAPDAGVYSEMPLQEVEQERVPPDDPGAPLDEDPDRFLQEDEEFGTLAQD